MESYFSNTEYMESLEESLLLNKEDIYYNVDKFDSGENRILYITGHSVSGKSTLSRELLEKYSPDTVLIEADFFTMTILYNNYDMEVPAKWNINNSEYNNKGGKILRDFFISNKEWRGIKLSGNKSDDFDSPAIYKIFEEFVIWLEKAFNNKKYKGRCILEGVQIARMSNLDFYKDKPLIIKGTSTATSYIRRQKRELPGNISWKKIKSSMIKMIPVYVNMGKRLDDLNNIMDENYIEESNIPKDIPRDISDLLKQLNSYKYGYIKNGKPATDMNNFFDDYKSLSISEFEKYKIGVCWDYVHYEANWFKNHRYKYETFYIQVQDEDNDCPSHTYLVFYLPGSKGVYYFESSWGRYQGIEHFNTITELHNTIKDRHISFAQSKCDPKTYFREKYDAASKSWEHLSCGEYMVKVSKGKIKLDESAILFINEASKNNLLFLDINKDKQRAIKYLKTKHSKYTRYIDNYDGEIIIDTDKDIIVGQVFVGNSGKDKNFITGLWVRDTYRGMGLGKRLLDDAVKKYKGIDLTVEKTNKVAVNMYKSYGFVNLKYNNDKYYWMKLKSKLDKNDVLEESYIEELFSNNSDEIRKVIKQVDKEVKEIAAGFNKTDEKPIRKRIEYYIEKYDNSNNAFLTHDNYYRYPKNGVPAMRGNIVDKKGYSLTSKYTGNERYYCLWAATDDVIDAMDIYAKTAVEMLKDHISDANINKYISQIKLHEIKRDDTSLKLIAILVKFKTFYKQKDIIGESYIEEVKRSELDTDVFGIPELRKYPMPDKKHVLSAIRFFNYVDSKYEKELARNIKKKMKEYDIPYSKVGDKNRLKKYLKDDFDIVKEMVFDGFEDIKPILVFDLGDVLVSEKIPYIEALTHMLLGRPISYAQEIEAHIIHNLKTVPRLYYDSCSDYTKYMTDTAPDKFKKYIPAAIKLNSDNFMKLPYTESLLKQLKDKGYKLYYLSNWNREGRDRLIKNKVFDFLHYFDGGIFSCDAKLMKPDHRIYEALFKKYNLDPKHCIFFDDNYENVRASMECGMNAILFNKNYTPQYIKDNFL